MFPCDRGTLASPIMLQRAHAPERPCYYKPVTKMDQQEKHMNNMSNTSAQHMPKLQFTKSKCSTHPDNKNKINPVQNINKST